MSPNTLRRVDCVGGTVTGTVLTAGTPVGTTGVMLTSSSGPVFTTTVSANGGFSFSGVPGGAAVLTATPDQSCTTTPASISVVSGGSLRQDLLVSCP